MDLGHSDGSHDLSVSHDKFRIVISLGCKCSTQKWSWRDGVKSLEKVAVVKLDGKSYSQSFVSMIWYK